MKQKIVLLVCLSFFASDLLSADLYVSLDSLNPSAPYSDWSTAATDIQMAVDEASDGDIIYIAPGEYTAQANSVAVGGVTAVVDLGGKFVSLEGWSGDRDDVVIDGEG